MPADPKPRIVFIATAGATARNLMRGQLQRMKAQFDVTVIASPDEDLNAVGESENVTVVGVPMARAIDPFRDLVSLTRLIRALRRIRPDVISAGTPKGALLGLVAAALVRVPVRIYLLRGLRLETTRGLKRVVLAVAERLTSACAHRIFAVSESLRGEYIRRHLARSNKIKVIRHGSSNGVDPARFRLQAGDDLTLAGLRRSLAIPPDAPVIGFVGRLTRDKGITDLLDVFRTLSAERPDLRLILIGPFEEDDAVDADTRAFIDKTPAIVHVPKTNDVRLYYHLCDVIAFPSQREGFPNVILEAACAGVPAVGYLATGVRDAIVDGVTGALVPLRDAKAMAHAIRRYLADDDLRRRHGDAARERAAGDFDQETLWQAFADEYGKLLGGSARAAGQLPD